MCTCRLEQLSAELLCQTEGKEFGHPGEGGDEHRKRKEKGETSKWAFGGEEASQKVKIKNTTA